MSVGISEGMVHKVIDDYLDFTCIKEAWFNIEEWFKNSSFYIYLNWLSFDSGVRYFQGNLVPIIKDWKDPVKELLSNVENLTFSSLEELEKDILTLNITEWTQIFIFREGGKYLLYTKTIEMDNEYYTCTQERVWDILDK